ncbi:hypothetical protein GCM10027416_04080 [Okibacterium endophyticum]
MGTRRSQRRWAPALVVVVGLFVTVAGLLIVVAEADARLASISVVGGGETEMPESDLEMVRQGMMQESIRTGTGWDRSATIIVTENGSFTVSENEGGSPYRGYGLSFMGWHLSPLALTSAAGLILTIGGLFLVAARALSPPGRGASPAAASARPGGGIRST